MARGRGRGQGHGWKFPLMSLGSTVGTRVGGEAETQAQFKAFSLHEEENTVIGTSLKAEVVRRLSLSETPPTMATLHEYPDLGNNHADKGVGSHGTVK
ncbi:hypothetical protein KY290_033786 [Solanum tuberosum]|uniref:Uncharacterized protein n=1 Tax=Solanum tuberosum TaxID=4113 RepID=A0ABQ7U1U5_SOLTU|nr:hypothetical protein KY290_033786 [Solanum tuberosum]